MWQNIKNSLSLKNPDLKKTKTCKTPFDVLILQKNSYFDKPEH